MDFFQSQNFIQGYNACSGIVVTMEPIGTVSEGRSKFLNKMYIYSCVRNIGFVYEFVCRKNKLYQCRGCKRLGKTRCIKIENDCVIPGEMHPEDGHHADCKPILETGTYIHVLRFNHVFGLSLCAHTDYTINARRLNHILRGQSSRPE